MGLKVSSLAVEEALIAIPAGCVPLCDRIDFGRPAVDSGRFVEEGPSSIHIQTEGTSNTSKSIHRDRCVRHNCIAGFVYQQHHCSGPFWKSWLLGYKAQTLNRKTRKKGVELFITWPARYGLGFAVWFRVQVLVCMLTCT